MINNRNLRFESSSCKFEAQVLRCFLKVNVVRLLVNRKRKLRICDFQSI